MLCYGQDSLFGMPSMKLSAQVDEIFSEKLDGLRISDYAVSYLWQDLHGGNTLHGSNIAPPQHQHNGVQIDFP
jgi:hypothetical protein